MKTTKAILILAGVLFLLMYSVSSKADTIDFKLTVPNTALSPYPSPYADVLVTTTATGATITFTALDSYAFGDGSALALNVSGTFSVASVSAGFTQVVPGVDKKGNAILTQNVDGFGDFNLVFDDGDGFSNPYFAATITLTGNWDDSAVSVLVANANGAMAAAHIGIPNPSGSGYIATGWAANGGAQVPEPGILILLGIAMSAIGIAAPFVRKI